MHYQLFSVDDHLLEPPDLWTSRLPAKYQDVCLRVVNENGVDTWVYEETKSPIFKMFATAGLPSEQWDMGTINYADMHPACYDPGARSEALRPDGIVGSVTFPTAAGFAGRLFAAARDKELAHLSVRAYNNFMLDEWYAADPAIFVPTILCQLWAPELAAAEIRRCAERGARSLSFPENPYPLGLPTLHDPVWNPVWQALTDTEIAVSMHGGSSGRSFTAGPDSHFMQAIVGGPILAGGEVITELMFSRVTAEFPDLKFVLTEMGVGYIPYLLERADYHWEKNRAWHGLQRRPSEVFRSCMYVPLVNERFAVENRHLVGVDNILWESDFPHPESFWPHSQEATAKFFAGVPDDEVAKMTHGNAAAVFRWSVPTAP